MGPGDANAVNLKVEFWLAVLVGLTLAIGLAPGVYWTYFEFIGWPHRYITHAGPLHWSVYGDLLCWGNNALLCIFPLLTLLLLATRPQVNQKALFFLYVVLPLIQIILGVLNILLLIGLLD